MRAFAAAVALAAAACAPSGGDGGVPADGSRRGVVEAGTHADAAYTAIGPCEPTFASIQHTIFAVGCNWELCHGGQSPAWGLWLLDPKVESELVNGDVGTCPGWKLVVPGSPERSFLWQKLTSDHPPCRTEPMPFGMAPLPPHALQCVRGWIEGLATGAADASADASDAARAVFPSRD